MPFQPVNFAGIQPQGNEFFRNLIGSLTQGYQAGQMPFQMHRQAQGEELANALRQLQLQQEPQRFSSQMQGQGLQNALMQQQLEENATSPFGGKIAPGAVGQAVWLDKVKSKYGENSEVYQNALRNVEAERKKGEVLNNYRDILAGLAPKRTSTEPTKLTHEIREAEEGYVPGTNKQQTMEFVPKKQLADQLRLRLQKGVSDTKTRERNLYATNMEKTIDLINPIDLVQYGGAKGQLQLKADEAASAFGKAPERYQKYQEALTNAELLAEQVRQFYGTSITPGVRKELQGLTNPTTWINNPQVALRNYKTFIKTLEREAGTFRGAVKSTKEFEGQNETKENDPLGIR